MISHRRDAVPTPGDPNAPTGREPLDIRLAGGAAASWLAVSVCVDRSAGSALLVAVCAGVGGALVLLIGARRVLGAAAIALALFCVALVLLPLAGRIAHARASALVLLARAHAAVTVTVTVQADPRVLAASGPAGARGLSSRPVPTACWGTVRGWPPMMRSSCSPTPRHGATYCRASKCVWTVISTPISVVACCQ